MATTTNYGWTTPDDTALVKDGAAAIRTLGSSVDTTTKALNPSTTLGDIEYRSSTANTNTRLPIGSSGQVLTVAAGVPSWANGFSNPLTTTGDIIYSSSGTTPARLGIGSTGNVLTVSGGVPVWSAPAGGGKVLQVVQATYSTAKNITSTSYTDTDLTASITPSATTSKILVLVSQPLAPSNLSGSEYEYTSSIQLVRGSTAISTITAAASITGNASSALWAVQTIANLTYLDSPATTSSTTYKTQAKGSTNTITTTSRNSSMATITLLEIGA